MTQHQEEKNAEQTEAQSSRDGTCQTRNAETHNAHQEESRKRRRVWWRIGVVGGQRIGVGGEEGEGHQVLTSTPAGQQAQHIDDVTGIRLATKISGIFSELKASI